MKKLYEILSGTEHIFDGHLSGPKCLFVYIRNMLVFTSICFLGIGSILKYNICKIKHSSVLINAILTF